MILVANNFRSPVLFNPLDGMRLTNTRFSPPTFSDIVLPGPAVMRAYWDVKKWRVVSTIAVCLCDEVWEIYLEQPLQTRTQRGLLFGFSTTPQFNKSVSGGSLNIELWRGLSLVAAGANYRPGFRLSGSGEVGEDEGVSFGTHPDFGSESGTFKMPGGEVPIYSSVSGAEGDVEMTIEEQWAP